MSIIHDALKKTQENLKDKDDKLTEEIKPISSSAVKQPEAKRAPSNISPLSQTYPKDPAKQKKNVPLEVSNRLKIVTLCICVLACGIIFYSLFYQLKSYWALKPAVVKQPVVSHPQPPPVPQVALAPKKKTPPHPTIKLNGIITMGNKRSALINDNVYEEGGEVEGKKIQKILADRVEISDEGTIKSLEVGQQL